MPWNGFGVYSLPPATFPEVAGTLIEAARFNNTLTDVQTGLNLALTKNGQNVPTADLPMGGYRHTGAGAAASAGQYLVYNQASALLASLSTPALTYTTSLNGRLLQDVGTEVTIGHTIGAPLYIGRDGATEQLRIGTQDKVNFWSFGRDNVTTGDLVVREAATERLRVRTGGTTEIPGRLSVGGTNPSNRLDVVEDSVGTITSRVVNPNAGASAGVRLRLENSSTFWDFENTRATSAALAILRGGVEFLRINASGDIGVGITTPAARLHLNNAAGTVAQRLSSTSVGLDISCNEASLVGVFGTYSNHALLFQTNAFERLRITSAGLGGFGTASPTVPWDVNGAIRTRGVTVASLPVAATAGAGARHFVTDATATTFAAVVAGGGANGVPVYSDGTNWRIG